MTEQEFRARLHQSLAGAEMSEEEKRRVLARLHGPQREVRHVNKKLMIAICALVLLAASVTAVAGGMGRMVDWQGNTVSTALTPMDQLYNDVYNRLESLPDGMMGYARFPNASGEGEREMSGPIVYRYDDLEAARAHVTRHEDMPWPEWLPEDYELVRAWVISMPYTWAHIEIGEPEDWGDGITFIPIIVPETEQRVTSYVLRLRGRGEEMNIRVQMCWTSSGQTVYVAEGESAKPLQLADNEEALLICGDKSRMLITQRPLQKSVRVADFFFLLDDGTMKHGQDRYDMQRMSVFSQCLSEDELLAIIGCQKAE